ncbi:MAG: Holliday junction branch migration DNA helicase RuvB [Candidatus Omnitrophica bacterium]|nr:Holliday junction branch migration DNA helicase RuvB [Candidatus Omnitrophota bacterium]
MSVEKKDINILKLNETEEDTVFNISLRPQHLNEFVGQETVVKNLDVALRAAKERKEPLEHVLLSGPPGLGKTSLAHIIAHEMNANITATSGPAIERAGDLIGILTNLGKGDIFFIDEIHRLSRVVEEFLYQAMEDFQIDFVIDKGPYAKTIKFNLKPFTLVGATTRSGLLTAPLRSRFGLFFHLDFYSASDLAQIIAHSSKILGMTTDKEGALEIGRRSRGTPRIANRLLRRVRDYVQVNKLNQTNQRIASQALDALNIDESGLDQFDRKVLLAIIDNYSGGPVGIDTLAATLNEDIDTLVDCIEPYLLKANFLRRTSRGREVTEIAYKHFNKKIDKISQKELF